MNMRERAREHRTISHLFFSFYDFSTAKEKSQREKERKKTNTQFSIRNRKIHLYARSERRQRNS